MDCLSSQLCNSQMFLNLGTVCQYGWTQAFLRNVQSLCGAMPVRGDWTIQANDNTLRYQFCKFNLDFLVVSGQDGCDQSDIIDLTGSDRHPSYHTSAVSGDELINVGVWFRITGDAQNIIPNQVWYQKAYSLSCLSVNWHEYERWIWEISKPAMRVRVGQ